MRYIITENRLRQFINSFIDNWTSTKLRYLYFDNILYMDTEDEGYCVMEYDPSDGRLWFSKRLKHDLQNIFNLSQEEIYKIMKEWFEAHNDVEVAFVES